MKNARKLFLTLTIVLFSAYSFSQNVSLTFQANDMILLHEGFVKSKSGSNYLYIKGNVYYVLTVAEKGGKVMILTKIIDNVDTNLKNYYSQLFVQDCGDHQNDTHYAQELFQDRNTLTQTTYLYERIWQYQPDKKRIVIKTTRK